MWEATTDADYVPYHNGASRGGSGRNAVPVNERKFIAWDGEGINHHGDGKPQSYVLFGSSASAPITSDTHLHTFDLLDYILRVGEAHPHAFHVGYAFAYDANMIVRSLHPRSLLKLHKQGRVTLRHNGFRYIIQFLPNKWFSVSRKPQNDKSDYRKISVRIFDIFTFFTTSFVKAYEKHVRPIPDVVIQGKQERGSFNDLAYIERYWTVEISCLVELAEVLRDRMVEAGFNLSSWHGPGALANYALAQRKMDRKKSECPPEVRQAAKYAYAGGRFEMFKLGRTNGPIYSLDINSAYPFGISRLPDLTTGFWQHRTNFTSSRERKQIARFGVYRVRLLPQRTDTFLPRNPGPLFHRDKVGNISFPWVVDGWYWSPEVRNVVKRLPPNRYEILEGWELLDASYDAFDWIPDMYSQRRAWKSAGISAEYCLKLALNSIYGKLAQRVGWNEETRSAPKWHQLEWAGWVTSNTRAMLWNVMARIPFNRLLAVETDGIYTTMDPRELGISGTEELGGWEIEKYDEILYVQSGLAWLRKGDDWTCKRRGLDARTFELDACSEYIATLKPGNVAWDPYLGETTRFIGLGAALAGKAPVGVRHCVWQTTTREISPGQGGKRVHIWRQCEACKNHYSAADQAHEMSIRSLAYKDPVSHPHDIPWDNDPEPQWRQQKEQERWLIPSG